MKKEMWCVYTIEYYSAIKNKDSMNFADKWMELDNITLSKSNQSPKDIYGIYSLISAN